MNGSATGRRWTLAASTIAFAACFAVWTIFSILGVALKQELDFGDAAFGLLVAMPILTGSLARVPFAIWAEQYGGRIVLAASMVVAAAAVFLCSLATSYAQILLIGLGIGLAGGSFGAGVAYVSKWYSEGEQGGAIAIFAIGNVGAAVTCLVAPFVLMDFGWRIVAQAWAIGLLVVAVLFWFATKDDPVLKARRARGERPSRVVFQVEPLKRLQVWRFSLYYFFVFGGFVALALWSPYYMISVYQLDIATAGALAALCFILPASVFRAYGARLCNRYGARKVMYWSLGVSVLCTFLLAYPSTDYIVHGAKGDISFSLSMGLVPFAILILVLGFFLSLGAAAVYKHIPAYYPKHVGSVGGLVGMIGGLGGVALPVAFGVLSDMTGIWTTSFMLLFALVAVALLWMHFAIRAMERRAGAAQLVPLPQLPEMEEIHEPRHAGLLGPTLEDWRPEDPVFWNEHGRRIARRNLWISIPCLLLAFSVWLVWSVVVAKLPLVGFNYATDELFWLAALPGLSGATLRIFYSFMVPIFGGRLWTTLSTASLLLPALGIGFAVQDPQTPYWQFLVLALLCGLGGGNFASSMANINFFYPKQEKGHALGLNAGLGNVGVSVMQFVVPLVIVTGVFSAVAGEPQTTSAGEKLWLQNAGFVWVPFLVISAIAAWFGMNDIAAARASFKEQSVIFKRKHNWIMCVLYTGTFGSFIGYSAGFPLLTQTQFPHVDSLQFVFLGPLVGALSRAATGWISDRYGGGRVTFWTFVVMILAVAGALFFLSIKTQPGAFWGFFALFMVLFLATGVGNASTFQMIPTIMRKEIGRLMPGLAEGEFVRQAERESAAIIAFTSAIAAYGAFFIPKSYGTSIVLTGGPEAALYLFMGFYAICLLVTWRFYTRRNAPVPC